MKYRQLGRNGPTVSAIGYGAMVLSPGIYNPVEEEESLTTIERVFDLGINFVDTADIYGQGHNERLIGGALRGRRNKVILATKFGGDSDEQGKTVPGMGRRAYISAAIDASLKRLGTDYVDLYYCIGSIQRRQSKKLSAQWPSWSEWGRCSIWACRKCRPRLFAGDTLYTLLQLCKVSTPFSCGSRRAQCCLRNEYLDFESAGADGGYNNTAVVFACRTHQMRFHPSR